MAYWGQRDSNCLRIWPIYATQLLSLSPSAQATQAAIVRLCSMKRVEFTPHQANVWAAVLGCFESHHVNRAVIELGMSADPFPDLGKLVTKCRLFRMQEREYTDGGRAKPDAVVSAVAKALRLEV